MSLWLKPTLLFVCQVMCEDDPWRSNAPCVYMCVYMSDFPQNKQHKDQSTQTYSTKFCTFSLTHTLARE